MTILSNFTQAWHTTRDHARRSLARLSPTHHDAPPPAPAHIALGAAGEQLAVAHLERHGYEIVATNVHLPIGRSRRNQIINAEIDIIAYQADTLCFIEVKTRRSDWFAAPQANVDLRKQRQITRAARVYRRLLNLHEAVYRYDVISVILPDESPHLIPRIELFPAFWTEGKFRKRRWEHQY